MNSIHALSSFGSELLQHYSTIIIFKVVQQQNTDVVIGIYERKMTL